MINRPARIAGPSVLVIVVLALLVIWPAQRATGAAHDREEAALTEIDDLIILRAQLMNITEQLPDLEIKLEAIDQLVPEDPDLAGFLTELDAVADATGVDLRDVVPAHSTTVLEVDMAVPEWDVTLFSLRVEGEYQELVNFAEALNSTERLVVVDHVNVGVGLGDDLIGDFELQIFHQAVAAESVAEDS